MPSTGSTATAGGTPAERRCHGTSMTHHTGLEQQPGLEPQGALVVQQLLPPMSDDVLGDDDRDHVPLVAAREVPDVLEDRASDLPVRGVEAGRPDRDGVPAVSPLPVPWFWKGMIRSPSAPPTYSDRVDLYGSNGSGSSIRVRSGNDPGADANAHDDALTSVAASD
jgi:hypothetical protein